MASAFSCHQSSSNASLMNVSSLARAFWSSLLQLLFSSLPRWTCHACSSPPPCLAWPFSRDLTLSQASPLPARSLLAVQLKPCYPPFQFWHSTMTSRLPRGDLSIFLRFSQNDWLKSLKTVNQLFLSCPEANKPYSQHSGELSHNY